MKRLDYKEVLEEFECLVDRDAMKYNIKPEQYSYSMVGNFIKFLKMKKIILVKK